MSLWINRLHYEVRIGEIGALVFVFFAGFLLQNWQNPDLSLSQKCHKIYVTRSIVILAIQRSIYSVSRQYLAHKNAYMNSTVDSRHPIGPN